MKHNNDGVSLNSIHHPEGDGVVPESLNPDSLETVEIEIPMHERVKELARQAGFYISSDTSHLSEIGFVWCSDGYPIDEQLERFAELVRQDERDAVIDIVARHGGSVEIEAAVRQRGEK